METIESKVAGAVLEKAIPVTVGGKIYKIAPPSTGTLILVSEKIAELPADWQGDVFDAVLRNAKDCRALGDIAAILVLGAARIESNRPKWLKKDQAALAKHLLNTVSIAGLKLIIKTGLSSLGVGDFFGLTTSLIDVNLLKRTKVEVVKTTASGQ